MGYYDEEGHYHSFRHGLERAADRIAHPFDGGRHHHHHHHGGYDDVREVDVDVDIRDSRPAGRVDYGPTPGPGNDYVPGYVPRDRNVRLVERRGYTPGTITVPCHHIRVGDLLILQGRPCQVIRINTSSSTGQHRYLGVDLFNKQLYEESSFATNPSSSVYVQNMLAPVFKQYRVLDVRPDGRVVCMTEGGDIKQGLPLLDQNKLYERLRDSFANGRGSVRVLVVQDGGRELAVDIKTVYGSRL